ncbi:MAG: hypothetical protein EU530_04035 [Promethearchaeota archaeon]|nr:MAG: hypothetical protein EU530_04035 [Candidatus Lokiarchaeota archaeon]
MTEERKIDTEQEPAMITQTFEEVKKHRFNKIHVTIIIFMACQVLFLITFSEPFSIFWGSHPIFQIYNDDVINRSARIIMIYHSLANPFVVANTFWIMEYYDVREKFVPWLKWTLLPGCFLSGFCGLIFAYTRLRFFHELFYIGLGLIFIGGCLFIAAAFPIPNKFPDPKNATPGSSVYGLNLENYSLVILAICVLVSTIYGGLAAMENFTGTITNLMRETDAFLAEEVVKVLKHDWVEKFIVSHLHIQLALSSAMVVMIGYKTARVKGIAYKIILWANPVGLIVISWGAWVLNHYMIWAGAGILILNTTWMAIQGWINISKDNYGDEYKNLSFWKKLGGFFKDPIKWALYFIYLYAQIVVTICGIIVGLQTREVYRSHEWVQVEYDFNVGHWHLLAVLIATLLLLSAIDHFQHTKTTLRTLAGWFLGIGGFIAFTGANWYMMRDPAVSKFPSMYTTFVGVWILVVGFIFGIIVIVRSYVKKRRGN